MGLLRKENKTKGSGVPDVGLEKVIDEIAAMGRGVFPANGCRKFGVALESINVLGDVLHFSCKNSNVRFETLDLVQVKDEAEVYRWLIDIAKSRVTGAVVHISNCHLLRQNSKIKGWPNIIDALCRLTRDNDPICIEGEEHSVFLDFDRSRLLIVLSCDESDKTGGWIKQAVAKVFCN